MVQDGDQLNPAMDVYERLEEYYYEKGKIDVKIFAELKEEMEKFEGSDDDIEQLEKALEQLQVNESDTESSASARGQLFQVVTNAFKTFIRKPNVRLVAQRAGEGIYSEIGEALIEQGKQSEEKSESQQRTQFHAHQHAEPGGNGNTFIETLYTNCSR